MQPSVHKIIYPTQKCTYTNVHKYIKTKAHSEYVCMNYVTQEVSVNNYYVHSNDKNVLMF